MNPYDMAAEMLGAGKNAGTALHKGLWRTIERADEFVKVLGGSLRSRQIIAEIIVMWELANPGEKALPR